MRDCIRETNKQIRGMFPAGKTLINLLKFLAIISFIGLGIYASAEVGHWLGITLHGPDGFLWAIVTAIVLSAIVIYAIILDEVCSQKKEV